MGCLIEHSSTIIGPDAGVEAGMHHQKQDQKNTGQTHNQFLANGRGKRFFKIHDFPYLLLRAKILQEQLP
jgi:hypothetical protein